jgi:hypothetical protein
MNGDLHLGYGIECPGCGESHLFYSRDLAAARPDVPSWTFNGNLDLPTFSPSMYCEGKDSKCKPFICHSFVTDGRIQFLSDCTHELAGQTVELPEVE